MQAVVSKETIELHNAYEEFEQSCHQTSIEKNEQIAREHICHATSPQPNIYSGNLISDIEMFDTFNGDHKDTLFNQLGKTCMTGGGRVYLKRLLQSPLCHVGHLKDRQKTVKSIGTLNKKSKQILERIRNNESSFLWLFQEHNQVVQDIYQMVYYRSWLTSWLNGNSQAISSLNIYTILVSPSIGILSPIVYFVMPYLVLYFKMGIDISFYTYLRLTFKTMFITTTGIFGSTGGGIFDNLKYVSYGFSLIFYFQSLFNSIELSNTVYKISGVLTEKVNNIIQFLRDCKFLVKRYWKLGIAKTVFGCDLKTLDTRHSTLDNTFNTFDDVKLDTFSLLSNFGSRLKIFKDIKPLDYAPLLQQLYMLDAVWTIHSQIQSDGYTYATFDESAKPVYKANQLWHPCIPKDRVVCNDIDLGGESPTCNMLITGPNAGGKSTLIKAILSNTVLAQTLTIVAAKHIAMTPFHLIHSQINVPDCKGKESLFEAEMHRCKDSLDMLAQCKGPSLIVMDEIFNSTNPVEGVSGAYAIAKRLGTYNTNMTILSTHYMYLTKIVKEVLSFANFKMSVKIGPTGDIRFPYKLTKGVCTQFIALELLKKNGFHADLIEDALRVKALLTT